jgi:hypothetical protein
MAQIVKVTVSCDICGADEAEHSRVRLAFDSVLKEIDLCRAHYDELKGHLTPFLDKGRTNRVDPYGRTKATTTTKQKARVETEIDLKALRDWAKKQKIAVPARGRIPKAIVEQFLAQAA